MNPFDDLKPVEGESPKQVIRRAYFAYTRITLPIIRNMPYPPVSLITGTPPLGVDGKILEQS